MKIVVASISHESNSFNPELTTYNDFLILKGKEIMEKREKIKYSPLAGIIDYLEERDVEIAPVFFAGPQTEGGFVAKDTYLKLKESLVEGIKKENNIDGVCLHLHGSMTVEDLGDAEGDIIASVREIVGDDVAIVSSLDMHAMVTKKMIKNANGLAAYRTAPHIDKIETGRRAAELIYESLANNYSLKTTAITIPLLVSGEQSESSLYPMTELISELEQSDKKEKILSTSYCLGFPWSDVSFNQASALVVTAEENISEAKDECSELADKFWDHRFDFKFNTEAYPIAEAIQVGLENEEFPVIITDSGDNPGAGGSENISFPLEKIIELEAKNILLAVIADEESYEKCLSVGEGEKVCLELGQNDIYSDSPGTEICGEVKKLGQYRKSKAAVLHYKGNDVIITDKRVMMTNPDLLEQLSLSMDDYQVIILKSGYLSHAYRPHSARTILGLAPGYTNQVFSELPYNNVPRPIFPLDKGFDWQAEKNFL